MALIWVGDAGNDEIVGHGRESYVVAVSEELGVGAKGEFIAREQIEGFVVS